ncbi:MAG: hypothetical protein HKP58_01745 [Desulfatitalea sp.]|nr:hypothetical protein [Desulfatitalea sp.]NNJ99110.1 hypothetical protein [Desulfatitalea sp.]
MTELLHSQFAGFLEKERTLGANPVFIFHGEPALMEQCVGPLIERLLNGAPSDLHCEVMEGLADHVPDLLACLNTYDLTGGTKVVWFKEARLFDTGSHLQQRIDRIREAVEEDDVAQAAKGFLNLCGRLGVEAVDVGDTAGFPSQIVPLIETVGEDAVSALAAYCRAQGWSVAAANDPLQTLSQAINKGFPAGHHLVITTSSRVPKNRKFYKIVQEKGVIIDCHVPLGERRADKMAQETVLRQIMEDQLQRHGKRMPPALFPKIIELTGFDPPTVRDHIQKLIDYIGDRADISETDVNSLLRRTRSDPIFALTNAVADRNVVSALSCLNALMEGGFHPLQILSALANQVRKLLVAKDFISSAHGRKWHRAMGYPQFQKSILPAVQAYDADMAEAAAGWQGIARTTESAGAKKRPKKKPMELALASNPGNAYPVFQTLLKAENFTMGELMQIITRLSDIDLKLKSSNQDGALLVKHMVMTICSATS